ncbi:type II toxin-antitoxin system RelE/ParE family toxin [Candidatus Parabeggiatoa sp. HSG14]|uniref:type II toxin-antitoxin system RelE/ParE family toxin n=1 Tax=Candidatus Parabeggiatoa sp. HSG14 TaxID=3055593 RepID=UPI0025A8964A|nr:type II toxin-antitoxin system RelE/ParE family toxin [Thiotrichales bacterium HSG14]
MKILFTELSEAELLDAIAYYELEHKGLGVRFKNEVKSAIKKITHFPEAYAIERGEVRRYLMHKFPYKILYSIEAERINAKEIRPGSFFFCTIKRNAQRCEMFIK